MPYYKEQYINRQVETFWKDGPNPPLQIGPCVLDSTELMTFRGHPAKDAVYSRELAESSVDPYAYFLDSTSEKKYHDRLNERGLKPQGEPDRGHPFELKRHTVFGRPHSFTSRTGVNTRQFRNCFVSPSLGGELGSEVHDGNVLYPASYKETGLDAFAQQAYSRTAPTSVVFDAGQFLGELREGLPRLTSDLFRSAGSILRNAGSDYLNVEFGWKPFITDLQNAARALFDTTNMFSQMEKRVHRSYSLPESVQENTGLFTGQVWAMHYFPQGFATSYQPKPAPPAGFAFTVEMNSTFVVKKSRRSKRWFEGEFTSFLPLGFDPNDYFQRFQQLVNPKITPATLWELAPWSWLVDWNLRIGDTIRANEMNANDKLIMHYGYAMETSVYETKVDWKSTGDTVTTTDYYEGRPKFGILRGETTYKRRLRANPFGFRTGGIGSLTGGQASVLGALGLTKFH